MSLVLKQTTQFTIRELKLITKFGVFDISAIFEELNVYDSLLMPCMTGGIVIKDSVGLSKRLTFDGSEYIKINIVKGEDNAVTTINKTFRIYKQSDRTTLNQSSEIYVLSFISEEFIYSEQQKISQSYTGSYDTIVKSVLTKYLKVPTTRVGIVETTRGSQSAVIPLLSPLKSIDWVLKRALDKNNKSNFVFFENKIGFNFVSLPTLFSYGPALEINFQPKNINNEEISDEFLGVRDFNYSSTFDLIENIRNGFYANKFIGFDILTRKITETSIGISNSYGTSNLNKYPIAPGMKNREDKDVSEMYDSRVALYPYQTTRTNATYVKSNDNKSATILDETHTYIPQRKAIMNNLIQKRLTIALPGNFALTSGLILKLNAPTYGLKDDDTQQQDDSMKGNYLIIGTRHIIRPDKHETVCEVTTDSTNTKLIGGNTPDLQKARNS
jgi:hypothetical protein